MNIQAKIKSKGFTVAQVASQMKSNWGGTGISQGSLSTALNNNPSIGKLKEVADIIGMSLSELVSDYDRPEDFIAMVSYNGKNHRFDSLTEAHAQLTDWLAERDADSDK